MSNLNSHHELLELIIDDHLEDKKPQRESES